VSILCVKQYRLIIVGQIQRGNYWGLYIFWLLILVLEIILIYKNIMIKRTDKENELSIWFLYKPAIIITIAAIFLTCFFISYANYLNSLP